MSGVFGGDGGSLTHVQLGGGDPTINENWGGRGSRMSGPPNLPGMNEDLGGKFYRDPFSAGNAGVAQDAGNINMTGIGNMARGAYGTDRQVGGGVEGSIPAVSGSEPTPAPSVKRPGFLDAIRHGGDNAANPALSKGGKFIALLAHLAESTAAGASGGDFGEGFLAAGNLHRRKQIDEQSAATQKIQLARQQQNDELNKSNINSEIALRNAQIDKAQQDPNLKPELVNDGQGNVVGWKDAAGIHGIDEPNTPAGIRAVAGAYKPKGPAFSAAEVALAKQLKKKPEDLTLEEINKADRAHQQAIHIDTSGGDARGSVTVAVPQPDGSSKLMRVAPGDSIPAGARPVAKFGEDKASADEQRRSDLANNLNENLAAFQDIVKRRPELFGPINGRKTELEMAIGSRDPDISALKTIREQGGMAVVGAHAMRNAQHIETAANALMSLHDSPDAILDPNRGTLARARSSVQTFINDANKKGAGKSAGAGPVAAAPAAPSTHVFSISAWKKANPQGDVAAAQTAAQQQKYTIVP